jgi:hypothetical protein
MSTPYFLSFEVVGLLEKPLSITVLQAAILSDFGGKLTLSTQ